MFKKILILVCTAIGLIGCQAKTATPLASPEILPSATQVFSYPEPGVLIYPNSGLDLSTYPVPGGNILLSGTVPIAPEDAPEPSQGNGSVSGILYSISDKQILTLNPFFLTKGLGESGDTPPPFSVGPDEAKGDITGTTDEKGNFSLSDVPPGTYFLIAWAAHDWPMSINSPDDEAYRVIRINANEKHLLGVVYFP